MPNTLLTLGGVTKSTLRLFLNSNAFLKNIDKQYDDQYAVSGAKVGSSIKIRLPNDYAVRQGTAFTPQSTNEQFTTLTVATQIGVDVAFTSAERALSIDKFDERIGKPMMNNLAAAIAVDVMSLAEQVPNFVANFDSSGNLASPVAKTWLQAGAYLDMFGVPRGGKNRMIAIDEFTQANTVSTLAGLFNSAEKISGQYDTGEMSKALGFNWMMDQTMLKHTVGAYGVLPTVNGAGQTGNVLTVTAMQGYLNVGDIIMVAGVNSVNRTTKQDNGKLAQFTITAPVAPGATALPIYPAITPPVGGVATPFQTVTASPANGATITSVLPAGTQYRKNLAFNPKAFTMATVDLHTPKGVEEVARETFDGVSMRMLTDYIMGTDQSGTRLDILYGRTMPRPEWCCIVADVV